MGWSGGTVIFDTVASTLDSISEDYEVSHSACVVILTELLYTLEDQDWDNQCESEYWNHPIVGKILGNAFEDEEE